MLASATSCRKGPVTSKTRGCLRGGGIPPHNHLWVAVQDLVQCPIQVLAPTSRSMVDDGVFGNRQGRQAADLWHFMMQQIEAAYAAGRPLCGVSADIEKCFNCIPRYPALCFAVLVGTPPEVTTAWAGALASMCRHFKVRDSLSAASIRRLDLLKGAGSASLVCCWLTMFSHVGCVSRCLLYVFCLTLTIGRLYLGP